jgi:hypothetical protein
MISGVLRNGVETGWTWQPGLNPQRCACRVFLHLKFFDDPLIAALQSAFQTGLPQHSLKHLTQQILLL